MTLMRPATVRASSRMAAAAAESSLAGCCAEVIGTPRSNLYKKLEQYAIKQETDG